jgi:hypothetical protein
MPDEFSITSVRLSRQLTAVPRMNSTTTASLISGLPPFVRWAPPMQFSTGSHEDDRKRSDGFPDSVTDIRAYQTLSLRISNTFVAHGWIDGTILAQFVFLYWSSLHPASRGRV